MSCARCMDSFLIKDQSLLHWLEGRCIPTTRSEGSQIESKHLHVGNQYVHSTHRLKDDRGFIHCRKCGCRATSLMQLLAKPCAPPRANGERRLKCIKEDRSPPGLPFWLNEVSRPSFSRRPAGPCFVCLCSCLAFENLLAHQRAALNVVVLAETYQIYIYIYT